MRLFRLLLITFGVLPALSYAQNFAALRDTYTLESGGVRQTLELARDEVAVTDAQGQLQVQKVAAVATAGDAQRRAVTLRGELVLYPQGTPRSEWNRRIVRRQIAVRLAPGIDAGALATATGLRSMGEHPAAKGFWLFEAVDSGAALIATEVLKLRPEVLTAEPQLARQQKKRFIPNDTLFSQQWHLRNTAATNRDVNITSVWDTFKGTGIRIGIIDDGLQTTHPDLSPNVDLVNDHDWNDGTPDDPNPVLSIDFHGTSCAGVAAARGNNGTGVSGAAPEATLVGLRLIGAATSDAEESEALDWRSNIIQIKSNSWGPNDDGRRLEGPGSMTLAALETATTSGRGGKGTVFLWAGGNGGDVGDNSNYDGYANSIYTIAIAALGDDGLRSYYSEPGANLIVTAPSNGATRGIVTTDLTGTSGYNTGSVSGELGDTNYTNDFGGTSSSTPLAAGCVALMLQANPNLGWRDVPEILIRTATKVDAANIDWVNNAAGFHFNHDYGAGLINTQAAVTMASTWTNLPVQTSTSSSQIGLNVAIPDNNATGITRTFNLSATNLRVEQATLTLSATHLSRGQLAVTLTSPSGTVSRLAERRPDTGDNYSNWTFSTVRCWGENSQGTWTVRVSDLTSGTTGTLTAATLTVHGTSAGPVNQPPAVTAAPLALTGMVFTDETLALGTVNTNDPEGDAITLAYQWQQTDNNATFTDIASATSTSIALSEAQSGKLVRCRITPSAATQSGAAFFTETVAVNRRPVRLAQQGAGYSYDSDLFLPGNTTTFNRDLIINEFSQGAQSGANREWVELLVLRTCDLRGWTLADRSGTYTTFGNLALWSAIAPGTTIIIYKGTERDALLPTTDDLNASDHTLVLGHTNSSAFTGGTWGGLSNSNLEAIIIRNAIGQIMDAVSLNNDNVYDAKLGPVGSTKAAFYTGDTETGMDDAAQWTIGNASAATPGAGNGGLNTTFVSNLRSGAFNVPSLFRLAAGSALVPGLLIDEATGVLSGTPSVPGVYLLIIERYTGIEVVSQTYPLLVLDGAGHGVIGAGQTWTLDRNTALPANLNVQGTLDTNGQSLTVNGALINAGTLSNTSGVLNYLHRTGPLPLGQIRLIQNPVNDLADADGDGICSLMEFYLGTDPSVREILPATVTLTDGRLTMSHRHPLGIGGVSARVEVSGDLGNWQWGPGPTQTMSETTEGWERVLVIRDDVAADRRFIRLRVMR